MAVIKCRCKQSSMNFQFLQEKDIPGGYEGPCCPPVGAKVPEQSPPIDKALPTEEELAAIAEKVKKAADAIAKTTALALEEKAKKKAKEAEKAAKAAEKKKAASVIKPVVPAKV